MSWTSYHTKDLEEKYLFKFLTKQWLEYFLKTGNIWFSRADQFGDKMECVRITDLLKKLPDFETIEKRKQIFLISCWHVANKESLAFWDTYSDTLDNRKNFAIRFERNKMINLCQNIFHRNNLFYYKTKFVHGKVIYKNMVNSKMEALINKKIKRPSFRKETAFKYENEYRFVIELIQPYNDTGFGYYLGNPSELPFDIIINPLLKKDEYNMITEEIQQMGFGKNIKPSVLTRWLRPDLW